MVGEKLGENIFGKDWKSSTLLPQKGTLCYYKNLNPVLKWRLIGWTHLTSAKTGTEIPLVKSGIDNFKTSPVLRANLEVKPNPPSLISRPTPLCRIFLARFNSKETFSRKIGRLKVFLEVLRFSSEKFITFEDL